MRRINPITSSIIAASMFFVAASPALAGDEERALAAIGQAQGKIDAAIRMKGNAPSPEALAKAQASLRMANEEYKSGKEQKAIEYAVEAQQYADTVIGEKNQAADQTAQAQADSVAVAQQDAASAQQEAANASAKADDARQRAIIAERVASAPH